MLRSLRLKTYERALKSGHFKFAWLIGNARGSAQAMLLPTAQFGTEKLLRKILHSGAKIDSAQLLVDARNSKTEPFEKMKALVQSGLDPNGFVGPRRLKLLNFAILNRDRAFFDFLMNQKIDPQIADRNDLLPIQAAQMMEEKQIEKALIPFGPSDDPTHVLKVLESLVINENMLFSELHELLKWCFKNSGFDLVRTTLPQTNLLRYRIRHENIELKVELRFVLAEEITLLLFKGEEVLPLQSLLPSSGKVDSKTLRGHVVTELKEILKQTQNTSYKRETPKPVLSSDEKALQVLGLQKGASEKEIIAAYRTLAKRYHPDVSAKNNHDMIQLNRAYETLRKK
jgi:hypothetical protein